MLKAVNGLMDASAKRTKAVRRAPALKAGILTAAATIAVITVRYIMTSDIAYGGEYMAIPVIIAAVIALLEEDTENENKRK